MRRPASKQSSRSPHTYLGATYTHSGSHTQNSLVEYGEGGVRSDHKYVHGKDKSNPQTQEGGGQDRNPTTSLYLFDGIVGKLESSMDITRWYSAGFLTFDPGTLSRFSLLSEPTPA